MFKKVLIGIVLLVLIGGGIAYAVTSKDGNDVVIPTLPPTTQAPTTSPTPSVDNSDDVVDPRTDIPADDSRIPNSPKQEPKPEEHDYIYNPTEYKIARGYGTDTRSFVIKMIANELGVSEEDIVSFIKQHKINKGDVVLVRGKVVDPAYAPGTTGVELESALGNLACLAEKSLAPWVTDALNKFKAGEEVILTLRGTAESGSVITNVEPVE
jgi:hypothetical protein